MGVWEVFFGDHPGLMIMGLIVLGLCIVHSFVRWFVLGVV